MSRLDAIVLRAFCVWTVWVWGTRIGNIWTDDARDLPFKAVHTVLAAVSVAFALAAWRIVTRTRGRGRVAVTEVEGTEVSDTEVEGTEVSDMVESAHESP
jgi:hypothetical protein